MKKQLLTAALVGFSAASFAQVLNELPSNVSELKYVPKTENNQTSALSRAGGGSTTQALGDTIFYESFGNGLAGDGTNGAWTNNGAPIAAEWEYRGLATTPDLNEGSRGAFNGGGGDVPLASTTAGNGFMIFDSDWLDNGGSSTGFGNGTAPTPHTGRLVSPIMDLTGYSQVRFSVEMKYRRFVADLYVLFSTDGGTTYPDTLLLFGEDVNTPSNSPHTDEQLSFYVNSTFSNSANSRIMFWFDGVESHGNTNGSGYYYAMIDDILIQEAPDNDLIVVSTQTDRVAVGDTTSLYYSNIPTFQAQYDTMFPGAFVASLGTSSQTNTVVSTTVTGPAGSTTVASAPTTLSQGDTSYLFSTTEYVMDAGTGTYTFDQTVASDQTDDFPVDNTTSWSVEVTDNTYARDFDLPNPTGSGYNGWSYEVYSRFDVFETDTLTSITAQFGENSKDGAIVVFNVYNSIADNSAPVFTSGFITLSSSNIGQWETFPISEADQPELTSGVYFLTYQIITTGDTIWIANNNDVIAEPQTTFIDVTNDGVVDGFVDFIPFLRMDLKGEVCANVSANITNLNCFEDNSGAIDAQVSGGTGTFTYAWSNGQTGANISNLSAGNYTVTVSNGTDCSVQSVYTVEQPDALDSDINNSTAGEATATGVDGTSPYTYAWDNGETSSTISLPAGGTAVVTITDANGCTVTDTAEIFAVSTNDILFASSLNIFPNPTVGDFNISFENIEGVYNVSVVSTIGQVIETRTVTASNSHVESFNLEGINNGIYFVTVKSESGSEATYRVVVK